jgi:DNA anti-recombination protein RmuC
VDPDLQQALTQFEGRLTARIDGVETRLRTYIEERDGALRTYIEERSEATETKLLSTFDERIEATETKLLSAFHNWAQTFEVRARGTSAAVREFDERLGMIEDRVAKLERSRN